MTKEEKERIAHITDAELRFMERHGLIELSDKYRKEIEKEYKDRLISLIRSDKDMARDLLFEKSSYNSNIPTDYFKKMISDIDVKDAVDEVKEQIKNSILSHKNDIVFYIIKGIFLEGLSKGLMNDSGLRSEIYKMMDND